MWYNGLVTVLWQYFVGRGLKLWAVRRCPHRIMRCQKLNPCPYIGAVLSSSRPLVLSSPGCGSFNALPRARPEKEVIHRHQAQLSEADVGRHLPSRGRPHGQVKGGALARTPAYAALTNRSNSPTRQACFLNCQLVQDHCVDHSYVLAQGGIKP